MHGRNRPFFFQYQRNDYVLLFVQTAVLESASFACTCACAVGWQQVGVGAWSIIKHEGLCDSVPWDKTHEGMCAPWDKTGNGQLRQARSVQDRTHVDPLHHAWVD